MDAVDVDKAVDFVLQCMNFDGGFGRVPGSESHAGQVCTFSDYIFQLLDVIITSFCLSGLCSFL